jgi:hypothetical protein
MPFGRKLLVSIVLVGAALVFLRGGYVLAERVFQRNSIPQKLHTGWFYAEGSCGDLMSYQGAFAFSLAQETITALRQQGLSFFDDIDEPDNAAKDQYFGGGGWKDTPVPPGLLSNGTPKNLYCGEHLWLWPKGITEVLQRPGSFYQTGGGRSIYVLPDLGLVVGDASDR